MLELRRLRIAAVGNDLFLSSQDIKERNQNSEF